MKYYYYIVIILALFLGTTVAHANGFGLKFDMPVGDYIANVDTNTYGLTDAEAVRFDFQLWNKDRSAQVDFDNVWVNITPTGAFDANFAGLIGKPQFGGVGMTYFFPKAGSYDLSVRYGKTDSTGAIQTVAEASFPMTVTKDQTGTPLSSRLRDFITAGVFGLVLGGAFVWWLKRK